MANMLNICESRNFLWSTRDILGKGATATVYRGLNKVSGDPVAVKYYSEYTSRPEDQIREFEVLKKINHENVIKLLAIEDNPANRKKLIVMELCNGGSLLTNLLQPENTYGLEESEFLLVLKHLCNGMKYLRDNNIIHRDLKPGNIMKCIEEDGTHVYKLTDFGAARELRDEETFQSLYGTEQYLHPDLYERAVLGKKVDRKFYASTDLWSVGVTLYHAATGTLPFRVYAGYKNKETLHLITTTKSSGVISGVQIKNNGPIIWSRDLPKECLLSDNMRKSVKNIIAGLLEANYEKIWRFDRFFKEVDILLSHVVINIFYVNKARLIKLYLSPDQKYEDLRRCLKDETKIDDADQVLLYKNDPLVNCIEEVTKICEYPRTSENHPLFLFNRANETFSANPVLIPEWEDFALNISVENDTVPAKNACVISHYCKREIDRYSDYCRLIDDSIENFSDYIDKDIKEMQLRAQHVYEKICILKNPASVLRLLEKNNDDDGKNGYCSRLKSTAQEFATGTALEVTNLYNIQCVENTLKSSWSDMTRSLRESCEGRASQRGKTQVEEMEKCWYQFTIQPVNQNYSYSTGQWHILERKKIRQRLDNVINILKNEMFPQYREMGKCFEDWYKSAQQIHRQIDTLKSEIEQFEANLKKFVTEFTDSFSSSIKSKEQLVKASVAKKVANLEHFKKRWTEYYNNRKNFNEILSENNKLMNQMQDFTKNLKL